MFDEVDLWVFPDVYHGAMQDWLRNQGKRVWGSGSGESLELDRDGTKKLMKTLGYPVGKYAVIKGVAALREYLKSHTNVWIKINKWRGHFETFHSPNYRLVEPRIDEIEYKLGAFKSVVEFVVENSLDNKFEIGVDGFTVDGQFPENMFYGIEVKDLGYLGMMDKYANIPEPITRYDKVMAPVLKGHKYRGFYSSEVRLGKDKIPYMIDHCARAGTPPNELYQEIYTNLPEIMWEGAGGKILEPEASHKFGAELLIHSTWADQNWQPVDFPSQYRQFVKLRNAAKIDGRWYVIPQSVGLPEIGSVIGMGESMKEAMAMACEVASKVQGYYIDIYTDSLDKAEAEIEKAKSFGISILGKK